MVNMASTSTNPRYDRLHFVLGQSDEGEASIVKDALHNRGIQHIAECNGSADRLFNALDGEIVDLIVYDFDQLRDRFVDVMQHVRKKVRGLNPFVVIVATVDESNAETVRRLVKAGVDDLIRRPVTGQRLMQTVSNMMAMRKPFVVAHDYVGPSRRVSRRGDAAADNPLIRVPNTMRSRAVDGVSEEELHGIVEKAVAELRDRQLVACAAEVRALSRVLSETYVAARVAAERYSEVHILLLRIEAAADDLRDRAVGTRFERIGDLANMALALTQRIERAGSGKATIEIQLLVKLAEAIHRTLAVERDSLGIAADIANTIARFTGPH
jgi:response regulator RpfG family c-di-GMP phosphodiesterase